MALIPATKEPSSLFTHRVLIVVSVVTVTLLLVIGIGATVEVLLLFFLSLLLAIALRGVSGWLHSHAPFSDKVSLIISVVLMLVVILLMIIVLGPRIASQADELSQTLPQSIQRFEKELQQYEWGRQFIAEIPDIRSITNQVLGTGSGIFARVTGIFSATLSSLANVAVVIFTALFLAIEPDVYIKNALRLVPKQQRSRARQIVYEIGDTLCKWLISRFISMVAVGLLTTVGLLLMGVPLALTLGVIAGLLSFIPTFGPILAIIPATLLGLLQSPTQALLVVLLYTGVQMIDNYLITPLIVRYTVRMPPALIIISQLLFGVVGGQLGLVLAAPLTAILIVVIRMIYVETILDDWESEAQQDT